MTISRLAGAVAELGIAIGLSAGPAEATLVTSLPAGSVVAIPGVNHFGPGPEVFGPGITWTSTNAANQGGSTFGYTGGYGFLNNGFWDGSLGPMIGLNDSFDYFAVVDTMTFALDAPVYGIGGFMSYVPGSTPRTIAVYDSGMNLIESANLSFTTSGGANAGSFFGFHESSANISFFTLTDNYIGITDLTIQAVPEPGSLVLLGSSLLSLVTLRLRRR